MTRSMSWTHRNCAAWEVAQHAFSMLKAGRLILYHDHVYRPVYAQAEQDVAQRIREMLTMNRLPYVADLDDEIGQRTGCTWHQHWHRNSGRQ